jgi:adenosylcobyric acid synthase
MFVGTCSDAGKSVINTGFCRILKQNGYHPAPYKAQNMSLNSYATPEGLEIGRAQATQAEACQVPCHTDMNPVLLKPTGEMMSQVIVNGKPVGNRSAYEYFKSDNNRPLLEAALDAYKRLSDRYSPVVLEGAGSVSELNLKKRDIVNMRMAKEVGADVYLVADIDRGGVFASVYGSIMLLDEEERALIKGVIINKFRGDAKLFDEGRQMIKDLTGVPVVGVIPYFKDIYIEAEDSVGLAAKNTKAIDGKVNVAVVLLEQMSNFTDFDALAYDSRVNLYFTIEHEELKKADVVILPGSKSTIKDFLMLQDKGIDTLIKDLYAEGRTVIGICGGYQMLGQKILDPHQLEGKHPSVEGIGLLPMETTITKEKTTVQQQFRFLDAEGECEGYEIHMGQSERDTSAKPLVVLPDGNTDGIYLNDRCWGTYMHGILDNQVVIDHLLQAFSDRRGTNRNYKQFKQEEYDRLADHLRAYLDVDYMYQTASLQNE